MKRTRPSSRSKLSRAPIDQFPGNSSGNKLLMALLQKDRNYILERCQFVDFRKHFLVHEIDTPIKFCYFITGGLASILSVMSSGKSVEVGLVGREGFIGLPATAGFATSPTRVVMQVEGNAFRISAADLKECLHKSAALELALTRFSQTLTLQATQIAACNRVHEVDQRLARWLLMSLDRLGGNSVPLTQDSLASMLGTRRASVTVAAGILQKAGLITYRRGDVRIDNRERLERAACECYETLKRQNAKWDSETERV
ncbi:MAG: Crp/Fnr family transcriptional regulator [Candidatus Acidiferrum sp.]